VSRFEFDNVFMVHFTTSKFDILRTVELFLKCLMDYIICTFETPLLLNAVVRYVGATR